LAAVQIRVATCRSRNKTISTTFEQTITVGPVLIA